MKMILDDSIIFTNGKIASGLLDGCQQQNSWQLGQLLCCTDLGSKQMAGSVHVVVASQMQKVCFQ